ncbi:MAG: lysine--tRNA ligase [SAR324 cluster bacterium]|nr:lysine--tRNA ligase [SAR324 cluster bacterium]
MSEESSQIQIRREKLEKIRSLGIEPFPYSFQYSHSVSTIKEQAESLLEKETQVRIAGRLMAIRGKGKTMFGHIDDQHARLQIYVRKDEVGEKLYELLGLCDIGDYLGATGILMYTKTGELTLRVRHFELLSKSIRPLPVTKVKEVDGKKEFFDEVADKEFRYRRRYVDLALNEKVASVFRKRTLIIQTIRQYLIEKEFLEVETPTLQSIYGGANATPFQTHHKALGIDFFLRISNELYLKRLVGGGFDRVFEFVKNFRNEGIDRTHNPEFSALEFYQAYADYTDMVTHCEQIWERCALAIYGTTQFDYQETTIDVKVPWQKITMLDAVETMGNISFSTLHDHEVQNLLAEKGWELDGEFSRGRALVKIFEETCETKLIQPIFVLDYPQESTPLCKTHRKQPQFVERFEAYVNCWEIANAYSELNDPIEQRRLLEEQTERGRGGESETHPYDEDFIRAMEYGMPPMGGIGMGIDRMIMLLTNQSNIRDVILFPTMRPE